MIPEEINSDDSQILVQELTGTVQSNSTPPASISVIQQPAALILLALLFGVGIICALDRVAMSVAILPMSSTFDYSETTKGKISAAFTIGYMFSMIPAGILASFASPSKVLAAGVGVWSIAQMLTPLAAYSSEGWLLFARFCMGFAEAVTTPSLQALVMRWVPAKEKAKTLAFLISGLQIGTVLAYQLSPGILRSSGWESVFITYGGLGLVWLMLWLPSATDDPPYKLPALDVREQSIAPLNSKNSEDATLMSSENTTLKDSKEGNTPGIEADLEGFTATVGAIPWKSFLRSKEVVAMAVAHCAQNWGLYLLLSWLPTYFSRTYGESITQSSQSSMYPFITGIITGILGGIVADTLISTKILSTTQCRKTFQATALIGPALCMHFLAQGPETPQIAELLFCAAVGIGSLSSAGHVAAAQDVAKKYTGAIYGLTSAVSVLFGSVATFGTGVILDKTNSFSSMFELTVVIYLTGAVWFTTQFESKKLFD